MHMHHQKWLTDKNNRPKMENLGVGKDKQMTKWTKVQAFVLSACEYSYSITERPKPIYTNIQTSSYIPTQVE